MSVLRKDGTATFYQVELFVPARPDYRNYDEWILCHQPNKDWREKYSFSACGDVWQQTGHHGTYDIHFGFLAMLENSQKEDNKGKIYRLVKRTISMKTEQIGSVCVQKKEEEAA